jgi:hypothetical protein
MRPGDFHTTQFQQKFVIKTLLFVIHHVFSKIKPAQKLQKLGNHYLLNMRSKQQIGLVFSLTISEEISPLAIGI